MAQEITLKKKITIRKKGGTETFPFGQLVIDLNWATQTDQDLALFFRCKNGEVGGVFSDEYRNQVSDLGSEEKFPFIKHYGDDRKDEASVDGHERIKVFNFDQMDQAFVCIINYDAALAKSDVTFAQEKAHVDITSDKGDNLSVDADSSDHGPVYCVCYLTNKDGAYELTKSGVDYPEVMDLNSAFAKIPGFALICNE